MARKKVKLNPKRVFSEEFKKARVNEFEKGEFTTHEIAKLYGISQVNVYRWIHKYSTYNKRGLQVVEMKESGQQKLKDYEKRIAELERALGQKQLKVDFLEKMIELAGEELNVDIKKNYSTPQSNGSGKTRNR
jgi:transposase-like protein